MSIGVIAILGSRRGKEIAEDIAQREMEQLTKAEASERLSAELKEKAEKALLDKERIQGEANLQKAQQQARIEELDKEIIELLEQRPTRSVKDTFKDYDRPHWHTQGPGRRSSLRMGRDIYLFVSSPIHPMLMP